MDIDAPLRTSQRKTKGKAPPRYPAPEQSSRLSSIHSDNSVIRRKAELDLQAKRQLADVELQAQKKIVMLELDVDAVMEEIEELTIQIREIENKAVEARTREEISFLTSKQTFIVEKEKRKNELKKKIHAELKLLELEKANILAKIEVDKEEVDLDDLLSVDDGEIQIAKTTAEVPGQQEESRNERYTEEVADSVDNEDCNYGERSQNDILVNQLVQALGRAFGSSHR